MKTILYLILTLASINLFGQDTSYYDSKDNMVPNLKDASYYMIVIKSKTDTNVAFEDEFYILGAKRATNVYSNYNKGILDGKQTEWYENGIQKYELDYLKGNKHGSRKTWFENGQLRRNDSFYKDNFISGKCYTENGTDTAYYKYQIPPEFPGGLDAYSNFMVKNVVYPKKARKNGVQGKVFLSCVVEPDGSITNLKVLRGDKLLSEEAIKVVKQMPTWKPGFREGKKARFRVNIPVSFIIED